MPDQICDTCQIYNTKYVTKYNIYISCVLYTCIIHTHAHTVLHVDFTHKFSGMYDFKTNLLIRELE